MNNFQDYAIKGGHEYQENKKCFGKVLFSEGCQVFFLFVLSIGRKWIFYRLAPVCDVSREQSAWGIVQDPYNIIDKFLQVFTYNKT